MDGALTDQARTCLIQQEGVRAWLGLATSESLQDGVIQTFLKTRSAQGAST